MKRKTFLFVSILTSGATPVTRTTVIKSSVLSERPGELHGESKELLVNQAGRKCESMQGHTGWKEECKIRCSLFVKILAAAFGRSWRILTEQLGGPEKTIIQPGGYKRMCWTFSITRWQNPSDFWLWCKNGILVGTSIRDGNVRWESKSCSEGFSWWSFQK